MQKILLFQQLGEIFLRAAVPTEVFRNKRPIPETVGKQDGVDENRSVEMFYLFIQRGT